MEKIFFNKETIFTLFIFLISIIFFNILSSFFLVSLFIVAHLNLARDNKAEVKKLSIKHGINKDNKSRMGGIVIFFFISYLIFQDLELLILNFFVEDYLYYLVIFAFVTFLGFTDDFIGGLHYIFKLYFLFFIVIFLLLSYDFLLIRDSKNYIINMVISNSFFSYLISVFVILGFINASNVADGANGILSGISSIFFYIIFKESNIQFFESLYILMFTFFCYNILVSKIFLGDSGSYLLGFLISTLSLYYYNNYEISAGLLATLLSYPCLEITFTLIRRFNLNKNPLKPDNKHLHNFVYNFLKKTFFLHKYRNLTNSISGILILLIFSVPTVLIYKVTNSVDSIYYWYTFLIQTFIYILIYFYCNKIIKN